MSFGLTVSTEEHGPNRLVEIAELAERTGFDFVSLSDHYHPWLDEQGHAPFVWAVLGAIAARTERLEVAVGVTCPTVRIHPAILAQATATTARLFEGRFTWGVGTGEALNEHILGDHWPPAPQRLEMLEEAVAVVRELWRGEQFSHHGRYYTVENARIYDLPDDPIPLIVSAFGPLATKVAARIGDGLWVTGPDTSGVDRWREAGGSGPVYSQLSFAWAPTVDEALDTAHRTWTNSSLPGQLSQDLPTPAHIEQASELVTRELVAESMPCGPDVQPIVDAVVAAVEAGIDHVYLHQIGDDQEGFCEVWTSEIRPAVDEALGG